MLGRSYQADASIIDAVRACKALGGTMSGETLSAMHRLSRDLILHIHDQARCRTSSPLFQPVKRWRNIHIGSSTIGRLIIVAVVVVDDGVTAKKNSFGPL